VRRWGSVDGVHRLVHEPQTSLIDELECVVWVLHYDEVSLDGSFQKRDRHRYRVGGTAVLSNPMKKLPLDLVGTRANTSPEGFSI
jgi:hypothetical protein